MVPDVVTVPPLPLNVLRYILLALPALYNWIPVFALFIKEFFTIVLFVPEFVPEDLITNPDPEASRNVLFSKRFDEP